MVSELEYLIERIKEKTSVEVAVFDEDGLPIAGYYEADERATFNFEIFSDSENNRTLFPLTYNNKNFTGRIYGSGETEKKLSAFITELASLYFIKDTNLTRSDFYKSVVFGEIGPSQIRRYIGKFSIPDCSCVAFLITLEGGNSEDVKTIVTNYSNNTHDALVVIDDNQSVFIKFEGIEEEFQSSSDYAEFLSQSIYEELGAVANVYIGGNVKSIYELSSSYYQAVATARMCKEAKVKGNVHSFKEFILNKMLEDLPKHKLNEYLEIISNSATRSIFGDEEMINTAEEFLENNLNISETSRKLYLHRNTLMYRLDKIERLTGLNIRNFSDALTFRLITTLARLLK